MRTIGLVVGEPYETQPPEIGWLSKFAQWWRAPGPATHTCCWCGTPTPGYSFCSHGCRALTENDETQHPRL